MSQSITEGHYKGDAELKDNHKIFLKVEERRKQAYELDLPYKLCELGNIVQDEVRFDGKSVWPAFSIRSGLLKVVFDRENDTRTIEYCFRKVYEAQINRPPSVFKPGKRWIAAFNEMYEAAEARSKERWSAEKMQQDKIAEETGLAAKLKKDFAL